MNKKELYNSLIAEVEEDKAIVRDTSPLDFVEAIEDFGKITLPEGVLLKTPVSAFAVYAVRDCVMAKAMEDEEFAYTLVTKIRNEAIKSVVDKTITQDTIEAVATMCEIATMWEQAELAVISMRLLERMAEDYDLQVPTIASLIKETWDKANLIDFDDLRSHVTTRIPSFLEELEK